MSDFDREAEREKLREKYEQDKQKREQSERLSELLLKGATMTDKHCDDCGDPIFRWDGQEFCPTCQQAGGAEATSQDTQPQPPDQPQPDASEEPSVEVEPESETEQAVEPTEPAEPQPRQSTDSQPRQPTEPQPKQPTDPQPRQPTQQSEPVTHAPLTDAGDLAAARASLERTLARLSKQAEQADTLSETRKYLAGAKEAAEALDAAEQI